ncbi:MAG: hypothetical protein ABL930_13680 [Pseudobdellovibrio sp.]
MKIKCLLPFVISSVCFAHGEDKPGPHKGFIRMPGNYHTEVVADNNNTLKVYLLDIKWKNPSVKQSKVKATHKTDAKSTKAMCLAGKDHYICTFAKSIDLTKPAELIIESQREGQKGTDAVYPLPLKLEKVNTGQNEHGGHH